MKTWNSSLSSSKKSSLEDKEETKTKKLFIEPIAATSKTVYRGDLIKKEEAQDE